VALAHQVSVKIVDGFRKEHSHVFPLRRRREFRAEQKNLVHSDVKGVGTKRVNYLVHQLEHDSPHLVVKRIPFTAIDALVVGKRSGCHIEGRIDG
jgi:hypothetical protein